MTNKNKKNSPRRKKMIEEGFFDGRFRKKIIPDKRKERHDKHDFDKDNEE